MIFSVTLAPWQDCQPAAQAVRFAVFVDEQGVPAEMELDEWDGCALHALACDTEGRTLGTGRLLPDGHIGRMAVLAQARGRGVGGALLRALIAAAQCRGDAVLRLNAQIQAAGFYEQHGFTRYGAVFDDAGLAHIAMQRRLTG